MGCAKVTLEPVRRSSVPGMPRAAGGFPDLAASPSPRSEPLGLDRGGPHATRQNGMPSGDISS
jgi:hypothetical protein